LRLSTLLRTGVEGTVYSYTHSQYRNVLKEHIIVTTNIMFDLIAEMVRGAGPGEGGIDGKATRKADTSPLTH